jgi:hypothetical protein
MSVAGTFCTGGWPSPSRWLMVRHVSVAKNQMTKKGWLFLPQRGFELQTCWERTWNQPAELLVQIWTE